MTQDLVMSIPSVSITRRLNVWNNSYSPVVSSRLNVSLFHPVSDFFVQPPDIRHLNPSFFNLSRMTYCEYGAVGFLR